MRPYLLASLTALIAGVVALPAKTGTIRTVSVPIEHADFSSLKGATRLILVVADDFDGPEATLQLFERKGLAQTWKPVSAPLAAVVGRAGLAWWPSFESFGAEGEPIKSEPDERTPAGIFPIGRSFGFDEVEARQFDIALAEGEHFCVDDVTSPLYNRIVRETEAGQEVSGERMWQEPDYRRGLVIDYPTDLERHPASCVFVHIWKGEGSGTAGCVGLPINDVETLQAFARGGPTVIAIVSKDALRRFQNFLPQLPKTTQAEENAAPVADRKGEGDGPQTNL